jgi:phage tail sheath protein FI
LVGSADQCTGLFALDTVDDLNILCIPATRKLSAAEAAVVIRSAVQYCESRLAFLIVDLPQDIDTVPAACRWMEENAGLASRNAAVYFPNLLIQDPLHQESLRAVAPSGTIAGIYTRTDSQHGVWKAPAGLHANLIGVQALSYRITNQEDGILNPLAINALRSFPNSIVCWGARTMAGSDAANSEWKYIPVRRLALYIESSLRRGLQWAVFEPNQEPLWSEIRSTVGDFLHNLFLQGALQGQSPKEAYLVQCDATTTTPSDIESGRVNLLVGFAPLKPSEFILLQIQIEQQNPQVQP